jgi:hypothetical protein
VLLDASPIPVGSAHPASIATSSQRMGSL